MSNAQAIDKLKHAKRKDNTEEIMNVFLTLGLPKHMLHGQKMELMKCFTRFQRFAILVDFYTK